MRGTWQTTQPGGGGLTAVGVLAAVVLVVILAPALTALIHALVVAVVVLVALAVVAVPVALVTRRRLAIRHPPVAVGGRMPWEPVRERTAPRAVAPPRAGPRELHVHLHGAVSREDAAALAALLRGDPG